MGYGYGKPRAELIVEARNLLSHDSSSSVETYEVHKPASLGRQRDQLVRTVLASHPDADLSSFDSGIATFYSRTQMIVAFYSDGSRSGVEDQFARQISGAVPF